jgi:hypothetical protein
MICMEVDETGDILPTEAVGKLPNQRSVAGHYAGFPSALDTQRAEWEGLQPPG